MVSTVIPTLSRRNFSDADEGGHLKHSLDTYVARLVKYKQMKEVIVVVNGYNNEIPNRVRDDNTIVGLKQTNRKMLYLGKNLGFTGACNAGAKIANSELLLFLNDDCDMSEDALRKMVELLEQNADVVGTQPIVTKVTVNGSSKQVENIGFWIDTRIGKATPVTVISNSKQERQDTRKGSFDFAQDDTKPESLNASPSIDCRLTTVDSLYGLSGTCLLIRKDIFEKVGMWDESFHSYIEDVDLAIRLQKAGYKVAPCLDAEVTHEHMATSSKMGLYKEIQDIKNWWRIIFKHSDVFVQPDTIFPLLLERSRNLSGLFKKILRRVIYFDKLSMT